MKKHYIFAMAETPAAPRSMKIFGAVYTEFGTLAQVEDGAGWIHLYNADGNMVSMKKVYAGWAKVFLTAQQFIGKEILIETGASSSHVDYFRDIVPENDMPEFGGRIFDNLPSEANIRNDDYRYKVKSEIVRLRIHKNRLHYMATTLQEQNQQMSAQLEQLTDDEIVENHVASEALKEHIDHFIDEPNRTLLIAGQCINKSKFPKQIDVAFAMRMKINVTKRRRIDVHVKRLIKGTNKLLCRLPQFRDEECIIGVRQSEINSTRGQWAAVHVENLIPGWWDLEKTKKYQDQKNRRKDIGYFLELHDEMVAELTKDKSTAA